ncbi:glutathione S-transferase family protein [Cupriavidus sp. M-11]|uniref:glutathione S-transferase family protein n=1 Tax=Cupriavidus sp. M-11 TaxID=3233038 RepID=UPI003F90B584
MITLFSYPGLFGLEDNNPYGLKVFAFLRLSGLPFAHRHILDTKLAPRGQLPYVDDDGKAIGDSDAIVRHLKQKYSLAIDASLTEAQHGLDHMIRRTLDDLYWVMSYSRWRDERYWPSFMAALLREHPELTEAALAGAQKYNFERYYYQGIGRFEADEVYARGVADLAVLSGLIGDQPFLFGAAPASTDAGLYGFVANIHGYDIDTPLKRFVLSRPNLVRHCNAVRAAMGQDALGSPARA